VVKFLSLFHDFNKVVLVWGDNSNLSQGLHIQKDFANFYDSGEPIKNSRKEQAPGSSDKAVRDLVNLSKKQAKDNDDLVLFQALLQKWQESLLS